MSWLERYGEPVASTPEEAAHYVGAELEQAVPKGWAVRGVTGDSLAWVIVKIDIRPDEWQIKEYGVQLSKGLDFLLFTHGNKDEGPLSLDHVLLQSLVIDVAAMRHFGIARCLEHLMTHYEPNEWGYT